MSKNHASFLVFAPGPGWIVLILLGLLWIRPALALNPKLTFNDYVLGNWSTEQGLPQISILSITQDRDGFLWTGTQNGIARFDGNHFVNYASTPDGTKLTLIRAAWADQSGHVWFGSAYGLFREQRGQFKHLGGPPVYAITGNAKGQPVLATATGVWLWKDGKEVPIRGFKGAFYSLLSEPSGLWAGGLEKVCRQLNGSTRCLQVPANIRPRRITSLVRRNGRLWLGTSSGLMLVRDNTITQAGIPKTLLHTEISSLLQDRDGNLWIGTLNAMYRIFPDGQFKHVTDNSQPNLAWINSLFEDRHGNLWLGGHTQGLFRASNGWTRRYGRRQGMVNPFTWNIIKGPNKSLLIGTNSNVSTMQDGHFKVLIPGQKLPNASAYTLYLDSSGRLWIGTHYGVALYAHGKVSTPALFKPLSNWQINQIIEWPRGTIWFGTQGGLFRFRDNTLTRYGARAGNHAARIRSIYPLGPDKLLLGTEDGVRLFTHGSMTTPPWATSLQGRSVTDIGMLQPGTIIVATMASGIGLVRNNRLHRLGTTQGLPNNNVWTFDTLGKNVYFSSIAGVWRIPLTNLLGTLSHPNLRLRSEMLINAQDVVEGIFRGRCCNGDSGSRSLIDGKIIWYPSVAGLVALDTQAIPIPKNPKAPIIQGLQHHQQWYGQSQKLQLPLGYRDINIHYTVPILSPKQAVDFRSKLDNYESAWKLNGNRRQVWYTKLPPGHYTFEVEARSASGPWSVPTKLEFWIRPYWYELVSVRLLAILLLLLTAWGLLYLRSRHQQRLQRRLQKLVDTRTAELSRANDRLHQANLALTEESLSDELTGLGNRRLLSTGMPDLLQNRSLCLLLVDLDHFKRINDRYGHNVGDVVLREVADLMIELKQPKDLVLRWGGEEFLIILPELDIRQGMALGEQLCQKVRQHLFDNPSLQDIQVTCSIGCSSWPVLDGMNKHDLSVAIELADLAMYRVKSEGRDGCIGMVTGPAATPESLVELGSRIEALTSSRVLRWLHSADFDCDRTTSQEP